MAATSGNVDSECAHVFLVRLVVCPLKIELPRDSKPKGIRRSLFDTFMVGSKQSVSARLTVK